MIGKEHTLSKEDQALCRDLAKQRYESNRAKKIRNGKVGPQSNEFTDLQGIGGEIAFCRLFNLQEDLTIHPRSSSRDAGDAESEGITFDVKTTKYETGKLLAVPKKLNATTDFYVLMTGVFPRYTYRGVMAAKDLTNPRRLGNLGYGDTFIATQNDLEHLEILELDERSLSS